MFGFRIFTAVAAAFVFVTPRSFSNCRCRTEGYGFSSIAHTAGSYDVTIDTWRPILPKASDKMRRYFIGGTPELDDLTYAGTPGDVDGPILSRYGFRTMSSGSVRLRMNIIHQSKAFLGSGSSSSLAMDNKGGSFLGGKRYAKRQYLMDRLSSATLFSSVSTVLDAFQKARERFARVTEGYNVNNLSSYRPAEKNVQKEKEKC